MAPFKLSNLRYLAPNALTAASLLLAVAAIVESMRGNFVLAAWMIVWCALLDIADGPVARWSRATSDFGMQFDSLSDLVAFGVAPAVLVYAVVTSDPRYSDLYAATLPRLGLAVGMAAYVLCTALRLVRYNLQTQNEHGPSFAGIPSTLAGTLLATYLLSAWELALPVEVVVMAPVVMFTLAGLMIGTFRLTRSLFPGPRGKTVSIIGISLLYLLGFSQSLPWVLFTVVSTFCLVGSIRRPRRHTENTLGELSDTYEKDPGSRLTPNESLPSVSPAETTGAHT